MKIGAILTGFVAGAAVVGVFTAFLSSSSPYVTIAEAKRVPGDSLHLAGDILKETVSNDMARKTLRFKIKDAKGDVVQVVYSGTPPANMGDATKVVAVGQMVGDEFHSEKMLVKCPSKYEGQQMPGATESKAY